MMDMPKNRETVAKINSVISKEYHGTVLHVGISGAHLYGFESVDSDIDWRGTFVVKTEQLLGLSNPRRIATFSLSELDDVVVNEVSHELGYALKSNCTTLEHIMAPQVITSADYFAMKDIIQECLSKRGLYASYKGLARSNYEKFIMNGKNSVKKYLYIIRSLMAGIHALETGRVEPNIETLNAEYFDSELTAELIQMKKTGREWGKLPEYGIKATESKTAEYINELFELIDTEYQKSDALPEEPSREQLKEADMWLKNLRRRHLDRLQE